MSWQSVCWCYWEWKEKSTYKIIDEYMLIFTASVHVAMTNVIALIYVIGTSQWFDLSSSKILAIHSDHSKLLHLKIITRHVLNIFYRSLIVICLIAHIYQVNVVSIHANSESFKKIFSTDKASCEQEKFFHSIVHNLLQSCFIDSILTGIALEQWRILELVSLCFRQVFDSFRITFALRIWN